MISNLSHMMVINRNHDLEKFDYYCIAINFAAANRSKSVLMISIDNDRSEIGKNLTGLFRKGKDLYCYHLETTWMEYKIAGLIKDRL